ncbi:MAG: Replicative DNA helicase, partial [Candidatus Amesbacteria bacterium GW2011_GWA2_47_70]
TALALNIAQNASFKHKLPVGFFSLEMSREELMDRLLVAQAEIDAWKLKTGRLDEGEFTKLSDAMGELYETPLYIDDTPGASILEMRTKARRLQAEHGLRLIIVDYLQLARPVRNLDNRVQEVSEISQGLKNLARELKIPVLALSQLSRQVESRGVKKPQLADLRESGAIEQDADVVMFMWRENDENLENMNLDIAKHRNGPLRSLKLRFKGDRIKFYSVVARPDGLAYFFCAQFSGFASLLAQGEQSFLLLTNNLYSTKRRDFLKAYVP